MPCIKRRNGCGFVCLYPGVRYGKPKMCGNTVVTLVSNKTKTQEFLGFAQLKELNQLNAINLTDIMGYNRVDELSSQTWVYTKSTDWLLGHLSPAGVQLVLQGHQPIITNQLADEDDPNKQPTKPKPNTVVSLFPRKTS